MPFDLGTVPSQSGRGEDDGAQAYAGYLAHAIKCGDFLSIKHFFARAFDLTTTSTAFALGRWYTTISSSLRHTSSTNNKPRLNLMPESSQIT